MSRRSSTGKPEDDNQQEVALEKGGPVLDEPPQCSENPSTQEPGVVDDGGLEELPSYTTPSPELPESD